jgi:hypothetical protein
MANALSLGVQTMTGRIVSVVGMFLVSFITGGLLTAKSQTIEAAEAPEFSVQRGFYTNSFDVTVSSTTPGATIKYTLDGSDPRTSSTASERISPATIRIDPESTEGQRGKTPGVILRACTLAPGYSVSEPITQTYLFVDKAGTLSPDGVKPGPNWPNPTTSANPQVINYGMDPDVLNDPRYKDLIDDALLAIPTISLATDLKHLFAPDSGIYMNALQDGREWERPASIELLHPDGTEGFHINAGIRIRGGWSRHGENPKHAFRFFFRREYGKGELEYPLFGSEGVDRFDKLDLRTSQNYSWSYPGHLGQYNTMNRDVFSRDLQREMGQPYTGSRYYHLYLNGVYWGLYQTQERSEARYAADYFGGQVEDYDVIKAGFDNYVAEATDGNTDAYRAVWNMCNVGFQSNTYYFRLQGLNADGTRNTAYKVLVDIDNLIDFMLVIFYGGNFDSPTSAFGQNKSPNNFFCIYNRNANEGFKFFAQDAEHTLRTTAGEGPGVGLSEDRVNIGTLTTGYKMVVSGFSTFHPQWLHFKLSENAEYRLRFADHVYRRFFNQGCMTPEKAAALFLSRAKEIEMAIIAESARWGDTYLNPIGTKALWQSAINDIVNNYFPRRTNIVLNQLKSASIYSPIDPPVFMNGNEEILTRTLQVEPGYKLRLLNQNSTKGTIQYTIDGRDPRAIGGSIAASTKDGGDEVEVTVNATTVVKARVQDGATWSALHEIILFADDNASDLKITEIHYHPLDGDSVDGSEYEFVELKNIGAAPINLSQAHFVDGITYTFPSGTIIDPNKFIVLASNRQEFNNRYRFLPFGEYSGQLDNGGERITLLNAEGDTIFAVRYNDRAPWPESPDSLGYSLVTKEVNPTGDLNDPSNWRASYAIHGSPGRDDLASTSVGTPTSELPTSFVLHQNYPNPFNPATKILYTLRSNGRVRLSVYNLLGQEVAVLVDGIQNQGLHEAVLSGTGLSSGVYFYRLSVMPLARPSAGGVITKKMALVR